MNLQSILDELSPVISERAPVYDRDNQFASDNLLSLKEKGLYKALIPTSLGGAGVRYSELCHFIRDLGRLCPATALTLSMHQHVIAVLTYRHMQGEAIATRTLEMVAKMNLILLSTGGGDWVSSNGMAKKVANGYLVNCRKPFCSGASIADVAVMSAVYDDGSGIEKVIHFSCPMSAQGIEIEDDWESMGMRASGSRTLNFTDVFIPEELITLERERRKWHPMWDTIITFAFPVFMAPYIGAAEALRDKTIQLIKGGSRKAPYKKSSLGAMENNIQIARWAYDSMIANANNFDVEVCTNSASRSAQAKSIITEHTRLAAQLAMEALGGYSYLNTTGIERYYRDIIASEFHPIQASQQKEMLGRFLMRGMLTEQA